MDGDQGRVVGQVSKTSTSTKTGTGTKTGRRVVGISSRPVFTITATVTKEMEISFTEQELAEWGGMEGAKASVLLECGRHGTIVDYQAVAKVEMR